MLNNTKSLSNQSEEDLIKIDNALKRIVKNKIKKILLINPPQLQTSYIDIDILKNKRYFNYPPYGLGLLRKFLIEKDYEVKILDLNFELLLLADSFINETQKFKSYMAKYNITNNSNKKNKKLHLIESVPIDTLMMPKLDEIIKKYEPDIIGITSMFTMTHKRMLKIARRAKEHSEDTPVFSGGVHPTSSPELILREEKSIDFICLYEGDKSVPALIDYFNNKEKNFNSLSQLGILVDNKYYQIDNRILPSGDSIPEYGDLDINLYSTLGEIGAYRFWWKKNTIASTILSNRGCRARCSFCSVRNFNGKGVRGKTIASVIDELEYLNEYYGVNHVMWLDDDLLYDRERTIGMFNEMIKRNLNMTWDASNGIIASALKDEVLDAAAESGCIGMHFGIESGSDKILREVHKPSGKKHYLALQDKLKKYPQIFTKGFLMVGFPNENLSQIKETIDMAKQIDLDWYTLQVVTPLPKTEMHEQMIQMGEITEGFINDEELNYGNRTGKLKEREIREKEQANKFDNIFLGDLNRIPNKNEMEDIWFLSDYKINYERISSMKDNEKLNKLNFFLEDVDARVTLQNPLINYYRSIILDKLNNSNQAKKLRDLSYNYLVSSEFWKKRFSALNLRY